MDVRRLEAWQDSIARMRRKKLYWRMPCHDQLVVHQPLRQQFLAPVVMFLKNSTCTSHSQAACHDNILLGRVCCRRDDGHWISCMTDLRPRLPQLQSQASCTHLAETGDGLVLGFILESETSDGDLSVSKYRANGWTQAGAGIGGPNDERDIQPPGIAQPAIGPATKYNEAAAPGIIHPCCVLPAKGRHHKSLSCEGSERCHAEV